MPRLSDLLLKNRRKRKGWVPEGSTDGLLDILSNVVGVMALVGSLTGVIAANSALNIQAPMSKKSTRSFHLVQVSANGLWDLQPAVKRMTELDRERGEEVRRCQQLLPAEQKLCNAQLDGWARNENIGEVSMEISHANGLIRAAGQPTISAAEIKNNPERLDDRRFCLAALIMKGVQVDRTVYAFCHDFTSSGACEGMLKKYEGSHADPRAFTDVYEAYLSYCHETGQTRPEDDLVYAEEQGVDTE